VVRGGVKDGVLKSCSSGEEGLAEGGRGWGGTVGKGEGELPENDRI